MRGFYLLLLVIAPTLLSAQTAAQLLSETQNLYESKDYLKALAKADELVTLTDTIAAAFKLRGDIKQRVDDFEGALDDYNQSKSLDNDNPRLYISRSAARINLGNLNGAIRDLERAIKLNPSDPDAHFNLACTKYMNEDNKGALKDLEATLDLKPKHADALFLRGVVRGEEYEELEGLADIEQALLLKPDIPGAQISAAILLYEFSVVIAEADETTRIDAFYYRGDCYYNLNDKDKACKDFRRAARFGDVDATLVVKQYCETDAKRIKKIPKRKKRDTSIQF